MVLNVILDALIDSAKMLPFLFLAYLLIEFIEHRHSEGIEKALANGGRMGVVPGALLGLVPQCGFSAMAANLYASKVITPGTLLAVFIATSDEAIPLLISMPEQWPALLSVLAVKLAVAMLVGFAVDILCGRLLPKDVRGGYAGQGSEVDCHEHEEKDGVFKAACKHTLHIFLFILLFNVALGALVAWIGEETIAGALAASGAWQPVLAGLVGLIPNCVSSVLLTQLFAAGQLSFGGMVAGLTTAAGVGLAVLLRTNKHPRQNLFILGVLYAAGVVTGMVCQLFF